VKRPELEGDRTHNSIIMIIIIIIIIIIIGR